MGLREMQVLGLCDWWDMQVGTRMRPCYSVLDGTPRAWCTRWYREGTDATKFHAIVWGERIV